MKIKDQKRKPWPGVEAEMLQLILTQAIEDLVNQNVPGPMVGANCQGILVIIEIRGICLEDSDGSTQDTNLYMFRAW
jgi:hypothetical protein